jgi:ABC-2 type transport system permease protein
MIAQEEIRYPMIENIVIDLRLYTHFLGMLVRSQAQYKVNVVVDIGASFAVTSLEFVAVLIYFGQVNSLLGWSVG